MAEGTQVGSIFYALDLDDAKFIAKMNSSKSTADSLGDKIGQTGDKISQAGSAFLPFSIAAGAALGEATKLAVDFDQKMELVHTSAGASQKEVDSLKQSVLDLATATGAGPDALAEGLYHVESVGYRGAQAMDILKLAAEGAAIGQANLDDTTYALTSTLSSQVQGAQNATEAMSTLTAIVGVGDMHMQDLNGAIGTGFLNSAKAFGISLSSVGAALATLTDNGEGADEAATRLRMTMSLMAAPSAEAEKALGAIGLSGRDLSVDLQKPNGLNEAMLDLKKHLQDTFGPDSVGSLKTYSDVLSKQGADAADKYANSVGGAAEALSKAFGGGRSDAAILTLLNNTDRLSNKFTEITDKSGEFGDKWAAQQQTAAQKMAEFKTQLDVLGIKLGNAFLPALESVAKNLGKIADAFSNLSPKTQEMIVKVLLVVAALGPVLKLVGSVVKVVGILVDVFGFLADVAELAYLALQLLAVVLGVSFGWLIVIIVAIVAVVAAIVLMITHWKKTKEIAAEVWHAVAGFFERMWHDIAGFVERIWNDVTGFFKRIWNDCVGFIKNLVGDVIQIFRNLFDFFTGGDITLTADHLSAPFIAWVKFLDRIRDDIIQWITDIIDWFKQTPHHILQVLDAIVFMFGRYLRLWWDLFTKWIPDIVKAVITEMIKLPGQIANIMRDVWNAVSSWFTNIWHDSVRFTSNMFTDVVSFFKKLPGEIGRWLQDVWNTISNWFVSIWQVSTHWIKQMFDDILGFFTALPGNILNFVQQMWNAANRVASGVWHGIMDTVKQLPDLIDGIFSAIWQKITGWAGKIADGAKHVASSMWNSFKNGLGIHSPSFIENAFSNIATSGDDTVDALKKSVGQLSDLSHKATQVTLNKSSAIAGTNSTMAFANLTINGGINFQNQTDIDYFFQKLGRNVELSNQGLASLR